MRGHGTTIESGRGRNAKVVHDMRGSFYGMALTGQTICVRIHSHGLNAHLLGSANDAACDLSAIRNENLVEWYYTGLR